MSIEITQELLHELLSYNPDTGILTWRKRVYGKHKKYTNVFNSKFAGKEAGTVRNVSGDIKYRTICIHYTQILSHRAIWLYVYGE